MSRKFTLEEVNLKLKSRKIYIESYDGINKPVITHCNVCGNIWKTRAGVLLTLGCGCPKCQKEKASKKLRMTKKQFLSKYKLARKWDIDEYHGFNTKSKFTCKKCRVC